MTTCFTLLLLAALAVVLLVTFIRWFEQTTDAVDDHHWHKLTVLVLMPFASWFFPSKSTAGRPTMVPRHEPVRGFGLGPTPPMPSDTPPPNTPKEFLGMPTIPPKKTATPKPAVDPEKLARLKQKMRDQGMLDDEGTNET
jgi:hypothetical protein